MSDLVISLIRTVVPTAVGGLLSLLVSWGVEFDSSTEVQLVVFVTGVLTTGYYALARFLEQRYSWAGWLLGSKQQPKYGEK